MNKNLATKIKSALEASEAKYYRFATMNVMNLYNNGETSFVDIDMGNECVHCVKMNYGGAVNTLGTYDDKFLYLNAGFAEISDFAVAGTYDQIQKIIDAMGISLDDEKVQILKNINASKSDIKPITKNYKYVPVSDEKYAKMTDEQKAEYDAAKKEYELRVAGLSGVASMSIDM